MMEKYLTDEERTWLNARLDDERIGRQLRAAMYRKQDKDWQSWSPKQRKRARQNGEYYGEDRLTKDIS